MADCSKCAAPLPPGASACPNCGRLVVIGGPSFSVWPGLAIGCLGSIVAYMLWLVVFSWLGAALAARPCTSLAVEQVYFVVTVVACVAAFVFAVRAARRGSTDLAVAIIMIVVCLLAPASACQGSTIFHACATAMR